MRSRGKVTAGLSTFLAAGVWLVVGDFRTGVLYGANGCGGIFGVIPRSPFDRLRVSGVKNLRPVSCTLD